MHEQYIPIDGQGNRLKLKRSALFADHRRELQKHGLYLLGAAVAGVGAAGDIGGIISSFALKPEYKPPLEGYLINYLVFTVVFALGLALILSDSEMRDSRVRQLKLPIS